MNEKFLPIKKVIIPAAGWGTRFLPMTKVVHKELAPVLNKPIIHYLAKEAADAGIEELILVISDRKSEILKYFVDNQELEQVLMKKGKLDLLHQVQETSTIIKVSVVVQKKQLGLGHAIYVAKDLVKNEPFGVILGDDLVDAKTSAIKQLIDAYNKTGGKSIIGVQSVEEDKLSKYGVVKPILSKNMEQDVFKIQHAIEKPPLGTAPSNKAILGRYVFTPLVMDLLKDTKPSVGGEINLGDTFAQIALQEGIYACNFEGKRYDLGSIEGFVKANIDYALKDVKIRDNIQKHINDLITK